jgi:hypothetical protein
MGIPTFIRSRSKELALLCRQQHARRLDLFGSAVRADFRPESSDLDFIVAFDELTPGAYSNAFFTLKEGLESMFSRPVDLLTEHSLRNPYLRRRVDAERVTVYGA